MAKKNTEEAHEEVNNTNQDLGEIFDPKFKLSVDMGNGKVMIHTENVKDGHEFVLRVNGKEHNIEILDNFGVVATGFSFSKYPAIEVFF